MRPLDPLETAAPETRRAAQLGRLGAMIEHVRATNPFYRRKLGRLPLTGWDDFHRLPFTTKAELVEDQLANPLFGTDLTYPLEHYVRLHQTSGTTGKPLRWLDTEESWQWWARCWAAVYTAAGIIDRDAVFFAFGFGPFVGFWSAWEGARLIGALGVSGAGQTSRQRLHNLLELGATVVCCTPSYALHLAEVARREGLDLAGSAVRATASTGR